LTDDDSEKQGATTMRSNQIKNGSASARSTPKVKETEEDQ
jgi:hypothetical protein